MVIQLGGWTGKFLWIDLSRRKHVIEAYDGSLMPLYFGGRGYAIRILWDHLDRGVDPLSPDNLLIFAAGPLTGLHLPSSGKLVIAGKSPLTGGYGDGNIGTRAAVNIKRDGYDAIIIKGKAEKPVYIRVSGEDVEILDAGDYWGLDASKIHDELTSLYGRTAGILTIGRAGEKLIRYAVVMSEKDRAGGRPGMGAIMGSKNLKAVVLEGRGEIPVYDPQRARELGGEGYKAIRSLELYNHWMKEGTMMILEWCQEHSVLPTYNFREGVFDGADRITGEVMAEVYKVSQKGCPNCNMVCGNVGEAKEGKYIGTRAELDYENVGMYGPNLGIDDMNDIIALIRRVDNLGMDTISSGSVIAYTIEAYKKGLLSDEDLDGVRPDWGDADSVMELVELIADRRKFGDSMAMGTRFMAAKLGDGASRFAMHVKGLEISAYDCHIAYGMALAFGTSPIGAHHKDAWFITMDIGMGIDNISIEKVEKIIEIQRIRGGIFETTVVCRFPWIELGFELDWYLKYIDVVTGKRFTFDDLYMVADRIYALIRLFWIREYSSWSRIYDMPPSRWFDEPLTKGPHKGRKLSRDNYTKFLDWYYELRGWDPNGVPRRDTLVRLGLEKEASEMEALGFKLS